MDESIIKNLYPIKNLYLGDRVHVTVSKYGRTAFTLHNGRAVTDTIILGRKAIERFIDAYKKVEDDLK